jgi:hypothetical protein
MGQEIFEKYHETFYNELHGWRDYELTSKGYELRASSFLHSRQGKQEKK